MGESKRVAERPIWWQADDAASMVELLEEASAATALDATPRPAPDGAPLDILHNAAMAVARNRLAEAHAGKDRILMEEVKAVDDLLRTSNLLIERLREWYALHAPELTRQVNDAEELTRLVAEHGDRATIHQALQTVDDVATGSELDPADLAVVQGFAAGLQGLHTSWRALENRIETLMQEVAPNIASVVGPIIGARLIALSGGLHRMGTMPSGTIQTLGAETALFRHIKEGSKPPKHGILFQHPLVFQAPRHQRGAMARALANHAALAARADATTGNDLREHLAAALEADLVHIRARKPKPPQRGPAGKGGPSKGRYGGKPQPGKPGSKGGKKFTPKGPQKPGPKPRDRMPPSGTARPPSRGGRK